MILRVEKVTKHFGGLRALADVSFNSAEGEILGIIGPNGAGKTTLFNIINCIYAPDAGQVTFRGANITGQPCHLVARLGLARTHQVVRPLGDLTVRENILAGACFGRERHSRKSAGSVADHALELAELTSRADQLAGTLNLPQKKRLELARAIAARPYLLLLDEVLAGLNPTEISRMLEIIRRVREGGVTILMIEHVMQAVMNISDRVLVLDYGLVIAEGSPREVVEHPQVIAAYLGDPKVAAQLLEA